MGNFQGNSDIYPGGSTGERLYAVCTVLLSLLVFSTFVSSLTNMMMQLQDLSDERNQQLRSVTAYLAQNQISSKLSLRVKKYVHWSQRISQQRGGNDAVIKILPLELMMDLNDAVRAPVLYSHE